MSTMAALTQNGRTFLLLNADAEAGGDNGVHIDREAGGLVRVADSGGVPIATAGAMSRLGLALLFLPADAGASRLSKILLDCRDVCSALARIEAEAAHSPTLPGGQVLLGDSDCIALVRYGAGRAECETRETGLLVCATSVAGDGGGNGQPDDVLRGDAMRGLVEELYAWLPTLDNEDVVERCQGGLCKEPLYTVHTRYSLVVDVQEHRMECAMRGAPWKAL